MISEPSTGESNMKARTMTWTFLFFLLGASLAAAETTPAETADCQSGALCAATLLDVSENAAIAPKSSPDT